MTYVWMVVYVSLSVIHFAQTDRAIVFNILPQTFHAAIKIPDLCSISGMLRRPPDAAWGVVDIFCQVISLALMLVPLQSSNYYSTTILSL